MMSRRSISSVFGFGVLTVTTSMLLGCTSSSGGSSSSDQDITATALPSFTGVLSAPSAKIRIHENAQFTMETQGELSRWYISRQEDHYAICDIERSGGVQIIQRGSQKILRLNVTQRKLLKSAVDSRSSKEDPAAICSKVVGFLGTNNSLDLTVAASGNHQFLILDPPTYTQPNYIHLENGWQGNIGYGTDMANEFALLFSPQGQDSDVTDLVSPSLTTTFIDYTTTEFATLEINPEFRNLYLTQNNCDIDVNINFVAISDGSKVTLRTGTSAAKPNWNSNLTGKCSRIQTLTQSDSFAKALTPNEDLFDITDLWDIRGMGPLAGNEFRKAYKD